MKNLKPVRTLPVGRCLAGWWHLRAWCARRRGKQTLVVTGR